MKRTALAAALGLVVFHARARAAVPELINFQARLSEPGGTPVADGDYDVTFSIHDASTGGSQLWTEDQTVTVRDGLFSVLLGSVSPLAAVTFDSPVWLALNVQGDGEMDPRFELASAPFALMARDSDKLDGQEGSYYEDWSNLTNVPAGFADGTDDIGGGADTLQDVCDRGRTVTVSVAGEGAIHAENTSPSGRGVYGYASDTAGSAYGVFGQTDGPTGYGVYGVATETSGVNYGVYGRSQSASGRGVYGSAPLYGVYGLSSSTSGVGVYGYNNSGTGSTYGVYGQSDSASGCGVYGLNFAGGTGVYGDGDTGVAGFGANTGVYAIATAGSGWTYGVMGESLSPNGTGVSGYGTEYGMQASSPGWGLYAEGTSTTDFTGGVLALATGTSGFTYGVRGNNASSSGFGVFGWATNSSGTNYGVYGRSESASGYGVFGRNLAGGYAGYFDGALSATGSIQTDGQLISTAAGAPLSVSSSTVVPNLNADMVDGKDAGDFAPLSHSHPEYDDVTGFSFTTNLLVSTTTYADVRSVTITAPNNGSVVVVGSCSLSFNHMAGEDSIYFIGIDNVSGDSADNWTYVRISSSTPSGGYSIPATVIQSYNVAAGNFAGYLKVKLNASTCPNVTVIRPSIVAMFF